MGFWVDFTVLCVVIMLFWWIEWLTRRYLAQQSQIRDVKDILDRHLAVLNEQQNWIRRLESKILDLERK